MHTLTTPLLVDSHMQTKETTLKDEAKKTCSNLSLPFCRGKVSGLPLWGRNWLIEQKDSALLILIFEGLLHVHFYKNLLKGRQTIENYLVHRHETPSIHKLSGKPG